MTQFYLDFLIYTFNQVRHIGFDLLCVLGVIDLESGQIAGVAVIAHDFVLGHDVAVDLL